MLDGKIMKNNNIITQMKSMQKKLKVSLGIHGIVEMVGEIKDELA